MSELTTVGHTARRIMIHELGATQTSHELARAACTVYGKLLVHLSLLLGEEGSIALFRFNLRCLRSTFPFFTEVLALAPPAIMDALRVLLEEQKPECVAEASTALLSSFVELLATFIGAQLTSTLLHQLWPNLGPDQSQETHK
jgi:hypothetical protein